MVTIRKIKVRYIVSAILMFISILIVISVFWANSVFSVTTLAPIIFLIKAPVTGADNGLFTDWTMWCLLPAIISTFLLMITILNFHRIFKNKKKVLVAKKIINQLFCAMMIVCLILAISFASIKYDVYGYFNSIIQATDLYEKYYMNPSEVDIVFPQEKQNIIHMYLESMESTYASKQNGGAMIESCMPELETLALDNINFSASQKIGGSYSVVGSEWTIAAMVNQNAGIPLSLPIDGNSYNGNTRFLPGSYTLGEVLQKHGYTNEIMLGSDAAFAGTKNFYSQHGNYNIVDYNEIKKQKRIPDDYCQYWGIEDKKILEFAKEDILKLASTNKPFNMEIVTIDPHAPVGCVCAQCPTTYSSDYANVIACQSKQVFDFVEWVKQQSFYQNTTIIITGDHTSMSTTFFENLPKEYLRTPYNVIVNSKNIANKNKNRIFSSVDWYPTILASVGATIKGDRLGLGTNLFSDKKTLLEELGFDMVNTEVQKTSIFYNQEILEIG